MMPRPRRWRLSAPLRALVRETAVTPANLIEPLFVTNASSTPPPMIPRSKHSAVSPSRMPKRGRTSSRRRGCSTAWSERFAHPQLRETERRYGSVLGPLLGASRTRAARLASLDRGTTCARLAAV